MRRTTIRVPLALGVVFALVATACTDDPDPAAAPRLTALESTEPTVERSAAALVDPVTLPAIAGTAAGGPRQPVYVGAEVTPTSWVSSSLSPTLVVPDASGPWTFTVNDLSDGESGFGPLVYAEPGPTARIPADAGLRQGRVYTWTAESPGADPVGGSFTVDAQLFDSQETDRAAAVSVALSSGEALLSWSGHSMSALGGSIGFGLRFAVSNLPEDGVPAGWNLEAASSSPYVRIDINPDDSVALVATNGVITNYEPAADGAYVPVQLSSDSFSTTGVAPVLTRGADGTFAITTKTGTTRFAPEAGTSSAYIVGTAATDKPSIGQTWRGGRLRALTDPVSGRSVNFRYGGDACPAPPSGFVATPTGMLCRVEFWDGSTSSIHYVAGPGATPTIGRLVDYPEAGAGGASVTDVAYDAAGRLARVRMPMIADLVAAGMVNGADTQFLTEISYDAEGRVASVLQPASNPGGTRCARTYRYLSERATEVGDSCFGRPVGSVVFDPTTFFTQERTNSLGQKASYTWDLASGQLQRQVSFEGLVTEYRYEGGQLLETRGPSKGPLNAAQVTRREYDRDTVAPGQTLPMTGLDITYWPSASQATEGGVQELGPTSGGDLLNTLTVNWSSSPAGNSGGWSAVMTGALQVDNGGTYQLRSNTPTAQLRVDNVLCADGGCDALALAPGLHQVRIDVSSSTPQAAIDITWSGPDTGGTEQSVPTDRLRPQYGYATTTEVLDPSAKNANTVSTSYSDYDNPADGRLTTRITQSGARATIEYEQGVGGRGGWGRQVAATQPSGNRYVFAYWGDKETAAPPCFGAKPVVQGGAAKSVASPAPGGGTGPSSTQWVDQAGRVIGAQTSSGAVICYTYDRAGGVTQIDHLGLGSERRMEMRKRVGGNPLVSELVDSVGGTTTVQRIETDMSGRTVRMLDRFGIETVTVYDDRTGEVASTTTTIPGVGQVVGTNTYDQAGRLVSYALDGRTMASITYNADGTSKTISYGNGVTLTNGYDQANRLNAMSWATPSGPYSSTQTISAGGHVSGSALSALGVTSVFDFVHDSAGRLSRAAVTAGVAPQAREWAYTYDGNSNRLSQTVTSGGAPVAAYSYSYDQADRLVASDDPVAAGAIEYDASGNVTKLGVMSFAYDAGRRLVSASDGSMSVSFEHSASGVVLSRTVTGGDSPGTVQFASAGVTVDEAGRPLARTLELPGGATYTRWFGDTTPAAWDFSSIDGDRFFSTDEAGATVGSAIIYDPFGQQLTTLDPPRPGAKRLTWQAQSGNELFETATPFVMMGARVYVPALGRFLQLDPKVGGGVNGYDYAGQNPVNVNDPSGESWADWVGTFVAAALSVVASVLVPAAGFLVGAAIGMAIGAISYSVTWLISRAAGSETPFSFTQLGISIVSSALFTGIAGRMKYAKAMKSAEYLNKAPLKFALTRTQAVKSAKDLNNAAKYLKYLETTDPTTRSKTALGVAFRDGYSSFDRLFPDFVFRDSRLAWERHLAMVKPPRARASSTISSYRSESVVSSSSYQGARG